MKRWLCRTATVLAAIAGVFLGTACSAHSKGPDQASVFRRVPARLAGTYRIAKAQFEEIDGRVETRWSPNELDVRCTTKDAGTVEVFVLRGVLGHRPDEAPRAALDENVPAFVELARTAAYRWDANQYAGTITAAVGLPDWMSRAIERWIFMIPRPPEPPASVGATWTARVVPPTGYGLAGEPYEVTYTLSKVEGCPAPDPGRCAFVAFVGAPVPGAPALARFGATVHGTARISLDGVVGEIRATVRYRDSVTVEEWTISRL